MAYHDDIDIQTAQWQRKDAWISSFPIQELEINDFDSQIPVQSSIPSPTELRDQQLSARNGTLIASHIIAKHQ